MAKLKIEMTPEQESLYFETKKLIKRANQRILMIERETGLKNAFGVKQLKDYLDSDTLKAFTEKGRATIRKTMDDVQMRGVKKAIEIFLDSDVGTVGKIKKYQKTMQEKVGKKVSYKQANVFYQASYNYTWIYQYMTPSEFWSFVDEAKKQDWGQQRFIDEIKVYITDRELDEILKVDLINLYNYAVGE